MASPAEGPAVEHNEQEHRFEVRFGDEVAMIQYARSGDRIRLIHTEVPPGFQGRGIAGKLAKTALEYAQKEGLKVVPLCPFVASYIKRHPEYEKLVDPLYRNKV
jgi:uncharacterized protein